MSLMHSDWAVRRIMSRTAGSMQAMVTTSDIIVVCILISISGIGFVFNTAFLIFSFVNQQVTSKLDYRWFLYGLASINFFYTLNMSIFQPYITLKGMDPNGRWCFITGFLVMMFAVGGVISQPLLSINRYFAMFHPEKSKKFFKKHYSICMVFGVYALSFVSAYTFVPFNEYGRFEGICCIAVYEMELWHIFVFFYSPMVVSYGISLYCAFSISKLIRNQVQPKQDREWTSKIREARFIIRFIYIEVFMPMFIEMPVFALTFVNRYFAPIPHEVMAVMLGFFIVHGTSDPIVMVLVIKPYRRLIKGWFRKFWPNKGANAVDPGVVAMTSDVHTAGRRNS